jgi:ABC-type multidrug transport system ATPase subunit
MAQDPVIRVKSLMKTYVLGEDVLNALDGVDLEIAQGEFLAIMGASGSGKSTLMNILGCLDRPTSGLYFLAGRDVARLTRGELLLADEPTGNLDSKSSASVMAVLQSLAREELTIVYVTHDSNVARYASRVVVMRDGRLISDQAQAGRRRGESSRPEGRVKLWQTLPLALKALGRNKTRSLLMMLGVVIGVASVISMVAVGEGARARVEGVFATMGTNMLIVLSGSTSSGGVMGGFGSMPTLPLRYE